MIGYLWYLLRHRWFVMVACWRAGLYWRGLVHDLSKFRPSEFVPYAHFFLGRNRRDSTGYYKPTDTGDPAFDFAWFLHVKRNDHHWQHWAFPTEDGLKLLDIPDPVLLEMVCDWHGAARAQRSRATVAEWWAANNHKMQLSPSTRTRVELLVAAKPAPHKQTEEE